MQNFKEKMLLQEKFIEKLFDYINWNDFNKQVSTRDVGYDYLVSSGENKYAVLVHNSLNFDTTKRRFMMDNYNLLKKDGLTVVIFVFNKVHEIIRKKFEEYAIVMDISNILYIIQNNAILTNELMGIIDYSIEEINPTKPPLNLSVSKKVDVVSEDKISLLNSIMPGRNSFKIYQTFCYETLRSLFLNSLTLWEEQTRSDEGLNIFDLICKIKKDNNIEFFKVIENHFNTKYIVFEFKNYNDKITQSEICITEKYLYDTALRQVALIFTRKGLDDNALKLAKGILRSSGKLILVFDDEDMKRMINLADKNDDPSIVLMEKLDDLLIHLDR